MLFSESTWPVKEAITKSSFHGSVAPLQNHSGWLFQITSDMLRVKNSCLCRPPAKVNFLKDAYTCLNAKACALRLQGVSTFVFRI